MRHLLLMILLVALVAAPTAQAAPQDPLKDVGKLPANYTTGWSKLGNTLLGLAEKVQVTKGDSTYALSIKTKMGTLSTSNALKVWDAMSNVYNGEWQKLGEQTANELIGKMFPLFAQYMGLHAAVKLSFTAILENWSQDLYQTKAYRDVVNVMNDRLINQAQRGEPYLPSSLLRPDTRAHTVMRAMEDKMFRSWLDTDPFIELQDGDNPYLIRHVFGKVPDNDREVFDRFLQQAVADQRDYIMTTYRRVSDDVTHEAMRTFYEQTVADLKRQQKMAFFIDATHDNYGGKLLQGPLGAGDIVAFESDVFIPFLYNGERAQLIWQVYRGDDTPIDGLRKFTNYTDGNARQYARLRFRIDNLPPGPYYAKLSRCVAGKCQDVRQGFTVGEPFGITQVYLSLDQAGRQRINRDPLSREAQFFQADYTASAPSLAVDLTITDPQGKPVYARQQEEQSAIKGRISVPVADSPLQEGITYTAKITLTAPDGKAKTAQITFTPKFYPLEITGPGVATEGASTMYGYKTPSKMVGPFRIETQKNAGEVRSAGDNRLVFTPRIDGNRTLGIVVVDSRGRKAVGFKQVQVDNTMQEELPVITEAQIAALQPKKTSVPQQPQRPQPSTAPRPQTGNPVPARGGDAQRLELGRRKASAMIEKIKQDIIAPCISRYFTNMVPESVNGLSQSELLNIADQSNAALNRGGTYYNIVRDQIGREMGRVLQQFPTDACGRQWASQLMKNGYISRNEYNAFVAKQTKTQPKGQLLRRGHNGKIPG